MTKSEFIAKYSDATKYFNDSNRRRSNSNNNVRFHKYTCCIVELISKHTLSDYTHLLGTRIYGKLYCDILDFNETDRIICLELFYNIVLSEKLYLKY